MLIVLMIASLGRVRSATARDDRAPSLAKRR